MSLPFLYVMHHPVLSTLLTHFVKLLKKPDHYGTLYASYHFYFVDQHKIKNEQSSLDLLITIEEVQPLWSLMIFITCTRFQIRRCNQMNENVTLVDFGGHILFLDSKVIAPANM